jgi:hypothetical protein
MQCVTSELEKLKMHILRVKTPNRLLGARLAKEIVRRKQNSMKSVLLVLVITFRVSPTTVGQTRSTISSSTSKMEISAQAVWKPREGKWEAIDEKCSRKPSKKFVPCIILDMRKAGASKEAIEFTQSMEGKVYLSSFREMGKVDLAEITRPLLNDPNITDWVFVNASQKVMELWDKAKNIDMTRDRNYPSLVRRFPNLELWPMHEYVTMQRLPQGGQRFVFNFTLLNGCRACELAGSAQLAFDFDESGSYLRTSLVRIIQ